MAEVAHMSPEEDGSKGFFIPMGKEDGEAIMAALKSGHIFYSKYPTVIRLHTGYKLRKVTEKESNARP